MPIPARLWITVRSTPRCNNFLGKRGFTLVELIMTVVVVSIVAIPLSLLISQHLESVLQSRDHTAAVNLARLEMEKVNNMAYGDLTIGAITTTGYQGSNYDLVRTIVYQAQDVSSGESLKKITVEVYPLGKAGDPDSLLMNIETFLASGVTIGKQNP